MLFTVMENSVCGDQCSFFEKVEFDIPIGCPCGDEEWPLKCGKEHRPGTDTVEPLAGQWSERQGTRGSQMSGK